MKTWRKVAAARVAPAVDGLSVRATDGLSARLSNRSTARWAECLPALAWSTVAAAAGVLSAGSAEAIVWNGLDHPERGVTSGPGLTDRPGIFDNVHVVYNNWGHVRGTATYLANGWILTARHVVQDGGYDKLMAPQGASFNVYGVDYHGIDMVEIPDMADMVLIRVAGDVPLKELKRSVISTDWNTDGRMVQMGGYGGHGWIDGGLDFSVNFHRGYNTAFSNGGHLVTDINGDPRLASLGLLEVGAISGDSGSSVLLLNGTDSQWADQDRYTIAGTLGSSGGQGFGNWSVYSRTPGYADLIRNTVWGAEQTVQYTFNQTGTGDLADMANFNASVPGYVFPHKSGAVNVNNGGTVVFDANSNNGQAFDIDATSDWGAELWAGQDGVGHIQINGGQLNTGRYFVAGRGNGQGTIDMTGGKVTTDYVVVGAFADGQGTFNMAGGQLVIKDGLRIAEGGRGTFVQTGGQILLNQGGATTNDYDRVSIGQLAGSEGVYRISGGQLLAKTDQAIPDAYNQQASGLNVGDSGHGRLHVSGDGLVATRTLFVGREGQAAGGVWMDGGNLWVTRVDGAEATYDSRLGGISASDTQASGSMHMTGGVFVTPTNFQIGAYGTGSMHVAGTAEARINNGYTVVGRYRTGQGVLTVEGGTFSHKGDGFVIVGEEGQGTLNVLGGQVNLAGPLSVGHTATGSGAVHFNGGVTTLANIQSGTSDAQSTVAFNGGTLRASGDHDNWIAGMDAVTIHAGGAVLDTQNHRVVLDANFQSPGSGSQGIGQIALLDGGSAYVGTPLVNITGGGGQGASAIAEVDPETGRVTGIRITNPGQGYTSAPTVSLLGGGGQGAVLGNVGLANVSAGDVTKRGSGDLVLAGDNAWAGHLNVAEGRLWLEGEHAHSSGVTVATGASLLGGGETAGDVWVQAGGVFELAGNAAGPFDVMGNVDLDGSLVLTDTGLALSVDGVLAIDSALLDVSGLGLAEASDAPTTWVLAEASQITGGFGESVGLAAGWQWAVQTAGSANQAAFQQLVVTNVPEPSLALLVGTAIVGVGLGRRRRV